MPDSINFRDGGSNTVELAADRWAGGWYPVVKIAFGPSCTPISESDPLPVTVIGGGVGGEGGGLTDAELRATPVPVSGTFYQATQPVSIASAVSVTGPLTDAQLRQSAVPVSGTFYPATQPVSGTVSVSGSVAVTGAFYQATQPVSIASMPSTPVTGTFWQATQPVSIASMPTTPVTGTFWQATQPVSAPTITKGTQGANGFTVQRLNDAGRAIVNAATAIAGVTTVTSEALLTLNVSRDGAATAGATTIAVTSGKRLRIIGITAGVISTSAAVISCRVALRMNPSGAVTATSPILAILPMSQQATALAQAGNEFSLMFSEAIEISGTMQVGLSQVASATTGTVWASLIAYEY